MKRPAYSSRDPRSPRRFMKMPRNKEPRDAPQKPPTQPGGPPDA